MEFVHPWFLAGLAALSLPVVIHLFNFQRHRKVYFTNVRFLQALQTETRRTSRLRSLILLLLRLLFLICLVMAFAQPYYPGKMQIDNRLSNAVSIYLDNSLSMEAGDGNTTLFKSAAGKAFDILSLYSTADRFNLLTNDLEGKHLHLASDKQINEWLLAVKPSPANLSTASLMQAQAKILREGGARNRIAFLISDFAKGTFTLPDTPPDTSIFWYFVPVSPFRMENVSIDSCWFDSPLIQKGLSTLLKIRLTNHSKQNTQGLVLSVMVNGTQRGLKSLDMQPGETTVSEIRLTHNESGFMKGEISINDPGYLFDNTLYFNYAVNPVLNVLVVNDGPANPYLNALFTSDSGYRIQNQSLQGLNYALPERMPLTILNELQSYPDGLAHAIRQALAAGRSVTVIPHPGKGLPQLQEFLNGFGASVSIQKDSLSTVADYVNTTSFLYREAIEEMPEFPLLPSVNKHYRMTFGSRSGVDVLIKLRDDFPFLVNRPTESGHLFILSSSLREEATDFVRNTLFVPTFINMVIAGERQNPMYAVHGNPTSFVFEAPAGKNLPAPRLLHLGTAAEIIPFHRMFNSQAEIITNSETPYAGIYELRWEGTTGGYIAVNHSRVESNPECYTAGELQNLLAEKKWARAVVVAADENLPMRARLENLGQGLRLWKVFVGLSLLFLASEVILLRFWK